MTETASRTESGVHFEPDDQVELLKAEIVRKLTYSLGKNPSVAQPHDWLTAGILAARDHIVDVWQRSTRDSYQTGRKRVYYLSLEFLIGRSLADALSNLGLTGPMAQAMRERFGAEASQPEMLEGQLLHQVQKP